MKSRLTRHHKPGSLLLTEFTTETVQRFITYLYTGKLSIPGHPRSVLELSKLLDKYELKESLPDSIVQKITGPTQYDMNHTVPSEFNYPLPSGVMQVPNGVIQIEQVTHTSNTLDNSGDQHNELSIKKEPGYDENHCDAGIQLPTAPLTTASEQTENRLVKEEMRDVENQAENKRYVENGGSVIEIEDKTCGQMQYFCPLCFYHSTTKGTIKHHLQSRHDATKCKICEAGVVKFVCSEGRMKQVVFLCTKCHKCHNTSNILQKHMKVHGKYLRYYKQLLNQDNLTCIPRNKLFPNETALNIHQRAHSKGFILETGKVKCQVCDKILNQSSIKVDTITFVTYINFILTLLFHSSLETKPTSLG